MGKRCVFVSCGQSTTEEKNLGWAIKEVIDQQPDLESYFAGSIQSLDALNQHVFDALQRSVGAVIVLHPRGRVTHGADEKTRSSVWVNQELAILAFRQRSEALELPTLVFADPAVDLEGAMTSLIANPLQLGSTVEVTGKVKDWLKTANFAAVSDDVVGDSWNRLTEPSRKVLASILKAGGYEVGQIVLQRTLMRDFGVSQEEVGRLVNEAQMEFASTDLASYKVQHAGHVFTVNPGWAPLIRRRIEQWRGQQ